MAQPTTPHSGDAQTHLAEILSQVEGLQRTIRQRIVEGADDLPLAYAEAAVVELLSSGPKSVPQLARARGTSRQNIQIVANRLVKEGFVQVENNPAHKRSPLLRLTDSAAGLPTMAEDSREQLLKSLAPHFSELELRQTKEILGRLGQVLGSGNSQAKVEPSKATPPRPFTVQRPAAGSPLRPKPRVVEAEPEIVPQRQFGAIPVESEDLPFNLL